MSRPLIQSRDPGANDDSLLEVVPEKDHNGCEVARRWPGPAGSVPRKFSARRREGAPFPGIALRNHDPDQGWRPGRDQGAMESSKGRVVSRRRSAAGTRPSSLKPADRESRSRNPDAVRLSGGGTRVGDLRKDKGLEPSQLADRRCRDLDLQVDPVVP